MRNLRIYYMMDGVNKYEEIEPKLTHYSNKKFIDQYTMLQHAEQYGECLREMGARKVTVQWEV